MFNFSFLNNFFSSLVCKKHKKYHKSRDALNVGIGYWPVLKICNLLVLAVVGYLTVHSLCMSKQKKKKKRNHDSA